MNFRQRAKYWLYNSCPGLAGRFPYYGTHVHFPTGAMIFRGVCQQGIYESEIVNTLTRIARPNSFVFDVGANIGLMAIPVLHSCSTCRVVSFEPSPNSLPFLKRTVQESVYTDRWTIIGKGLAHQSGELDFKVGPPEEALFDGFKGESRMSTSRVVKVPVSTLDNEWRQLGSPDVSAIKIDVEGAEGLVLEGGIELINANHPNLIVEWHASYLAKFGTPVDQLLAFAGKFGYRIFSVPGGVPVDETRALYVQMMVCSNFVLLH